MVTVLVSSCVSWDNNRIYVTELQGRLNELMDLKHLKWGLKPNGSLRRYGNNVGFESDGLGLNPNSAIKHLCDLGLN